MEQMKILLKRLKRPSVILSLVSQILSLMVILGFSVDHDLVMVATGILCSILVTLGILSNPDTEKKGFGDDILKCSASGKPERHVKIGDQMICVNCGAAYVPE